MSASGLSAFWNEICHIYWISAFNFGNGEGDIQMDLTAVPLWFSSNGIVSCNVLHLLSCTLIPKNYSIFFLNFAIFGNTYAYFLCRCFQLEFRHIAVYTHAYVINNNGQIRSEILELCALDNLIYILSRLSFGSRKGLFIAFWYL